MWVECDSKWKDLSELLLERYRCEQMVLKRIKKNLVQLQIGLDGGKKWLSQNKQWRSTFGPYLGMHGSGNESCLQWGQGEGGQWSVHTADRFHH